VKDYSKKENHSPKEEEECYFATFGGGELLLALKEKRVGKKITFSLWGEEKMALIFRSKEGEGGFNWVTSFLRRKGERNHKYP